MVIPGINCSGRSTNYVEGLDVVVVVLLHAACRWARSQPSKPLGFPAQWLIEVSYVVISISFWIIIVTLVKERDVRGAPKNTIISNPSAHINARADQVLIVY